MEMWDYIKDLPEDTSYRAAFMDKFGDDLKNMIAVLCVDDK